MAEEILLAPELDPSTAPALPAPVLEGTEDPNRFPHLIGDGDEAKKDPVPPFTPEPTAFRGFERTADGGVGGNI